MSQWVRYKKETVIEKICRGRAFYSTANSTKVHFISLDSKYSDGFCDIYWKKFFISSRSFQIREMTDFSARLKVLVWYHIKILSMQCYASFYYAIINIWYYVTSFLKSHEMLVFGKFICSFAFFSQNSIVL